MNAITTYSLKNNKNRIPYLYMEKSYNIDDEIEIRCPEDVKKLMDTVYDLSYMAEEYVYAISIGVAGTVLGIFEISHGTVSLSFLNPREILIRCLLCGAVSIIMVHNHTGKSSPSTCDKLTTERLEEAAQIVGIRLLDHIIVSKNGLFSFKENGLIKKEGCEE